LIATNIWVDIQVLGFHMAEELPILLLAHAEARETSTTGSLFEDHMLKIKVVPDLFLRENTISSKPVAVHTATADGLSSNRFAAANRWRASLVRIQLDFITATHKHNRAAKPS
jgi:hypothetical protein